MANLTPVWFITAASSGFGHELAVEALKRGHTVIATARNVSKIQDLADAGAHTLTFDVLTPYSTIETLAKDLFARYGRINYLVNAAGHLLLGAIEEVSLEEIYNCFNVNLFGAINTIRAFLPHMRAQPIASATGIRATIVTFGSLGGWKAYPSAGIYCMTKACATLLAESLNDEIGTFAMRATVVEAGHFRTAFLNPETRIKAKEQLDIYDDENTPSGQFKQILRIVDGKQPGDVAKGAKILIDVLTHTGVAEGRELPGRVVLGSDCEEVIRGQCASALKGLDDWTDVVRSTDYPQGQ
ncbi:Oxidoreductase BOA17-like protein [Cladobotryum mycophilum]|uniref:Oxidoreductase BOA17-like protein n=1 Tax=Cladobotryum mycophilum TaxID=491253 RepID=A0ABR0SW27_9HYPO